MENGQQRMITTYEYGNPEADVVLIQLTGEHELAVLENEVKEIRKRASSGELDFRFIAAKVENWNDELSPWKAPAVFKNEDFGGGAAETLGKDSRTVYRSGQDVLYWGIFSGWPVCAVGSVPDGSIFRCCGSFSVCVVPGLFSLYERAQDENRNLFI